MLSVGIQRTLVRVSSASATQTPACAAATTSGRASESRRAVGQVDREPAVGRARRGPASSSGSSPADWAGRPSGASGGGRQGRREVARVPDRDGGAGGATAPEGGAGGAKVRPSRPTAGTPVGGTGGGGTGTCARQGEAAIPARIRASRGGQAPFDRVFMSGVAPSFELAAPTAPATPAGPNDGLHRPEVPARRSHSGGPTGRAGVATVATATTRSLVRLAPIVPAGKSTDQGERTRAVAPGPGIAVAGPARVLRTARRPVNLDGLPLGEGREVSHDDLLRAGDGLPRRDRARSSSWPGGW